MPPHATECRIINKTMVVNEGQYALMIPFHIRLCQTNELHIIVVQPILSLLQLVLRSRLALVFFDKLLNPFPIVL